MMNLRTVTLFALVFLAPSVLAGKLNYKWHNLLGRLYSQDTNHLNDTQILWHPKVNTTADEPRRLFAHAPAQTLGETYAAFAALTHERNFDAFFAAVQRTPIYMHARDELAKDTNLTPPQLEKLIRSLWTEFVREPSNDIPSNWYTVYLEEKAGQLEFVDGQLIDENGLYTAKFRNTGANSTSKLLKRRFFAGTSPEFDLIAYTLCAFEASKRRPVVKCGFKLGGAPVSVVVRTVHGPTETRLVGVEAGDARHMTPADDQPGDKQEKHEKHRKHDHKGDKRGHNETEQDAELQALIDALWEADVDRAPEGSLELNWQTPLHGRHEHGSATSQPLFAKVDEKLFERPLYASLINIFNHKFFTPDVCKTETPIQDAKRDALRDFFNNATSTKVFETAYDYLKKKGRASEDRAVFLEQMFTLWFGTYSRCHQHARGSSGFEHVYLGEMKGRSVDGQHSWVRYYLLEKAGDIRYHGYFEHDRDFIGTIQYTWEGATKETGGFFISTSPAFDFALFTTCVLSESGSRHCRFAINHYQLFVTSFIQDCSEGGKCIATSYPGIVG